MNFNRGSAPMPPSTRRSSGGERSSSIDAGSSGIPIRIKLKCESCKRLVNHTSFHPRARSFVCGRCAAALNNHRCTTCGQHIPEPGGMTLTDLRSKYGSDTIALCISALIQRAGQPDGDPLVEQINTMMSDLQSVLRGS